MKILVLGLDCAPEILLKQEDLPTIRGLMDLGCYGRLKSVIPPITVPAWMCLSTSQDPGSLGVYGFRNRADHSYDKLSIVTSRSIQATAIWDALAMEGKRSICVGVPPGYPPRKVNGLWVGCFLVPDTTKDVFTHPPELGARINELAGGAYPVDVKGFRTDDKSWLRDHIFEMSRTQWGVVRHLMQNDPWDYFQFVDIGLDRVHHGFWKYHDPSHVDHEPNSPFQDVIREYYRHLDGEIARTLELLDSETIVLLVSDHGARALDGGFCVNEWLVQQGDLVLNEYPAQVTPFGKLSVDWSKTRAWSEGGYYARVFMNVKGREPHGTIDPADYESARDDLKARLEATTGPDGKPLGTLVWRPEELYKNVKNVAPDLVVHFGALSWRSIGGVGYKGVLHVRENDTGPDDCNHAQYGAFVLAAPNNPLRGEIEHATLLDIAPTLLDLAGADIPASMQGRSLVAGRPMPPEGGVDLDANQLIRDRLSGLGYIA